MGSGADPGVSASPESQDKRHGAIQTTLGYAGMFYHARSGLYLTHYRAYDPRLGRWLSRDPIWESGGINLYGYVGGDPVSQVDRDGRFVFLLPLVPLVAPSAITAADFLIAAGLACIATDCGTTIGEAIAEAIYGPQQAKPPENAYDPNGPKSPGKPGPSEGFEDPKGGENWVPNPNPGRGGSSHGWEDIKGRVWCPTGKGGRAHGGPHWDVQLPDGRHVNVPPGTNIEDLV
jgi:RHS repeat-associated protein